MQADRVEVSWDPPKSNWLVRIVSGEEVILRHCKMPQNADEPSLRAAALKTLQDEGYDTNAQITVLRAVTPV
jgi:hypothetical protein